MTKHEIIELLAAYSPKPRSIRACRDLLRAVQIAFEIPDQLLASEQLIDLRGLVQILRAIEQRRLLSVLATLAEVSAALELRAFALSVVLSSLDVLSTDDSDSGAVGERFAILIDSFRGNKSNVRDATRLFVINCEIIREDRLPDEFNCFLAGRPLLRMQYLGTAVDSRTFFKLSMLWWQSLRESEEHNALLQTIIYEFQRERVHGRTWWDQSDVICRTTILIWTCVDRDDDFVVSLLNSFEISLFDAPQGICQHLASALLLRISAIELAGATQASLVDRIMNDREFEAAISSSDSQDCTNEWAFPTFVMRLLLQISITFAGDTKGTAHRLGGLLFDKLPTSFVECDLQIMFDNIHAFRTLWYMTWLNWVAKLDYDNHKSRLNDQRCIDRPFDELFEVNELFSRDCDELRDIVTDAVFTERRQEVARAAYSVVQKLQSRHRHPSRFAFDVNRDEEAGLQISEAILGITEIDDHQLSEYLNQCGLSFVSADMSSNLLSLAATCNLNTGRLNRASILISELLKYSRRDQQWGGTWAGSLLMLEGHGQLNLAIDQIMSLARDRSWIDDVGCGPIDVRSDLAAICIKALFPDHISLIEAISGAVCRIWRSSFRKESSKADRMYNLEMMAKARHTISRAFAGLKSNTVEIASKYRTKSLLVDIEFSQRLLIDEQRFWSPGEIAENAKPLSNDVARSLGSDVSDNSRSSDLKTLCVLHCDAVAEMREAKRATAKESRSVEASLKASPNPPMASKNSIGEFRDFDEIDLERWLVESLKPCSLLLKIGISLDGRLVWSGFRVSENQLRLVNCDMGNSAIDVDAKLRELISQFEKRTTAVLTRASARHAESLIDIFGAIEADFLDDVNPIESYREVVKDLAAYPDVQTDVIANFGRPDEWVSRKRPIPQLAEWELFWSTKRAQADLDEFTRFLLSGVERIVPVAQIASLFAPGDDVVLMMEDVLYSIPFAFLRASFDGREKQLFEMVRSFRTVVAPLAQVQNIVNEIRNPTDFTADQVLCISGLPNERSERSVTQKLFDEHSRYAKAHGLSWRGAWENPRGGYDVMAKGISDVQPQKGHTALLTILGHGVTDGGFLFRFPDDSPLFEVWTGKFVLRTSEPGTGKGIVFPRYGCDLSSVDFLLQVSCSLGRLSQQSFVDLRGFATNLIIAGTRSMVAARWPILADHAVNFANDIAKNYLDRRASAIEQKIPFKTACIRGQALADARKGWVAQSNGAKNSDDHPSIGLYTVAAFELYGFG